MSNSSSPVPGANSDNVRAYMDSNSSSMVPVSINGSSSRINQKISRLNDILRGLDSKRSSISIPSGSITQFQQEDADDEMCEATECVSGSGDHKISMSGRPNNLFSNKFMRRAPSLRGPIHGNINILRGSPLRRVSNNALNMEKLAQMQYDIEALPAVATSTADGTNTHNNYSWPCSTTSSVIDAHHPLSMPTMICNSGSGSNSNILNNYINSPLRANFNSSVSLGDYSNHVYSNHSNVALHGQQRLQFQQPHIGLETDQYSCCRGTTAASKLLFLRQSAAAPDHLMQVNVPAHLAAVHESVDMVRAPSSASVGVPSHVYPTGAATPSTACLNIKREENLLHLHQICPPTNASQTSAAISAGTETLQSPNSLKNITNVATQILERLERLEQQQKTGSDGSVRKPKIQRALKKGSIQKVDLRLKRHKENLKEGSPIEAVRRRVRNANDFRREDDDASSDSQEDSRPPCTDLADDTNKRVQKLEMEVQLCWSAINQLCIDNEVFREEQRKVSRQSILPSSWNEPGAQTNATSSTKKGKEDKHRKRILKSLVDQRSKNYTDSCL